MPIDCVLYLATGFPLPVYFLELLPLSIQLRRKAFGLTQMGKRGFDLKLFLAFSCAQLFQIGLGKAVDQSEESMGLLMAVPVPFGCSQVVQLLLAEEPNGQVFKVGLLVGEVPVLNVKES